MGKQFIIGPLQLGMAAMCLTLFTVLTACSEDAGLNIGQNEDLLKEWPEQVDSNQHWITSMSVQLDIEADQEADITAQTILNDHVTILGQKHIKGSNVMFVNVPQGVGSSFGLVYDDGSVSKKYRRIDLTGEPAQQVSVDFTAEAPAMAQAAPVVAAPSSRAATNTSLYGRSVIADAGYMNFGSWVWDAIANAVPESVNASSNYATLVDYEIKADGSLMPGGSYIADEEIYISFLYGFTGQTASRVLGYYYHSPGDYSDIVYQDIAETLSLDYLNGNAKVQYQLDGNTGAWYDANFDYMDGEGLPLPDPISGGNNSTVNADKRTVANDTKRRGDDAYNVFKVRKAYGDRVTGIRGLTFKINVPAGKEFGFYLRENSALSDAQKSNLKAIGMPDDRMPKYSTNFSNALMNKVKGAKSFRSSMAIYDNFTFMGIDDSMDGGDYDCNDITFGLMNAKGEKYIPSFTDRTLHSDLNDSTLKEHPEYANPPKEDGDSTKADLQSWTIAMENGGTDIDFDFNDVVLSITPDTKHQTASVELLATGAMRKTELYYDGKLIGEVHALLGQNDFTKTINTEGTEASVAPAPLPSIEWPEKFTIEGCRDKFMLKVYDENDGSLLRTVYPGELLGSKKNIPQSLCVAGSWSWPQERQRVHAVYPLLGDWAVNFSDPKFWNWYAQPHLEKVVKPKKKKH